MSALKQQRQRLELGLGCLTAALVLGGLGTLIAGLMVDGLSQRAFGPPATSLNLPERLGLGAYLLLNADALNTPASNDPTPRDVTVPPGATANQVADLLAAQGLVANPQLLTWYMRYRGLDARIEAGDFMVRASQTPAQLAETLTNAAAREVRVRLWEGWRREQMATALAQNPNLNVNAGEFLELTAPGARPGNFAFYALWPTEASLEGALLPDTYLLRPASTAREVILRALAAFEAFITPEYQAQLAARNLTVYQAVIIASLIEREAVVDDERPLIASVIFNRLAIGQRLEIDATVQYAIATPENWWPPVAGLNFRAIDNPYNTYAIAGLPVGPIASVRPASLRAVVDAPPTNYYFYRATCNRDGRHNFATTYEEHLANACP